MAAELVVVDRIRSDLLANVSHELRTPIAALQARLDNLVDGVEAPDIELLRSMLHQTERLGRLVTQFLDLSRLESRSVPLRLESVDLSARLDAVAAEARLQEPDRCIETLVRPEDLALVADADRIHQVLADLTTNALRNGPPGRPVRLSASTDHGDVVLTVSDEGPGIPDSKAPGCSSASTVPTIARPHARCLAGAAVVPALFLALRASPWLTVANLLALIVALLASGDAVFARLLLPGVTPGPVIGHNVLIALFGIGVLFTVAAAGADTEDEVTAGPFGAIEVVTMLVLAAGVLGLFVVSQLVALTATGERLLTSSGLTTAECARSGFFQLCWATGTLVAFLGLVRALAAPGVMDQRVVRLAAGGVPLLSLGLVVVCLRRMSLYDEAFGLTMLRLSVVAVALCLGVLLVLIAVPNLSPERGSSWVLGASAAAALALILTTDILDPEAFVVRHNLDRAAEGAELDVAYLAQLSDDALPALAGALGDPLRAPVHQSLRLALRCEHDVVGVARLNVAAARAAYERARLCDE